ncbi:hypothetical protein [uncultured Gimesia sp.]|uniref:hypothetical protein n=1 Tax=uncultured Gimesia sp. TaxID=1678688 RepID=UPI0026281C30|nr:hypothetical protein [uncultured Gimesia sp.]
MSTKLQEAIAQCSSLEEAAAKIVERAQHMEDIAWEKIPGGEEHAEWEQFIATLPTAPTSVSTVVEESVGTHTGSTDASIVEPESQQKQVKAEALTLLRNAVDESPPSNPAVLIELKHLAYILENTAQPELPALYTHQLLEIREQQRSLAWRYRRPHVTATIVLSIAAIVFGMLWLAKRAEVDLLHKVIQDSTGHFTMKVSDRVIDVAADPFKPLFYEATGTNGNWIEYGPQTFSHSYPGVVKSIKRILPGNEEIPKGVPGYIKITLAPEFQGYIRIRQGDNEEDVVITADRKNTELKNLDALQTSIREQMYGVVGNMRLNGRSADDIKVTVRMLEKVENLTTEYEKKAAEANRQLLTIQSIPPANRSSEEWGKLDVLQQSVAFNNYATDKLKRFDTEMRNWVDEQMRDMKEMDK